MQNKSDRIQKQQYLSVMTNRKLINIIRMSK